MKDRVLVICPHYLPGYKAGGPIKSVSSIVDKLGDEFAFHVVTSASDLGGSERYPGVTLGRWVTVGKAQVLYTDSGLPGMQDLKAMLAQNWSCVYLNGFFATSTIKVLLALKILRSKVTVLLAPRGEFSPGALQLKRGKKALFLTLAKVVGLYRRVLWHASTELERSEIAVHFPLRIAHPPGPGRCFIAGNLSTHQPAAVAQPLEKQTGTLRVAFLSRVSRKKNLHYALEVLSQVPGRITFDIWGPLEDEAYWSECQGIIEKAPAGLEVMQKGPLASRDVVPTLGGYHLFLFPTLGENFGHVILEAMTAGCALLLSDTTPWRGLREKGYGWDLPLAQPDAFVAALTEAVNWDAAKFEEVTAAARAAAAAHLEQTESVSANRRMFAAVCGLIKSQREPLVIPGQK